MSDLRPDLAAIWDAFSVAATVTPPHEAPVETDIVWLTPFNDVQPGELEGGVRDPIRLIAIRRSDVPLVPVGTVIVAPELGGGSAKRWRVDAMETEDVEFVRVIVVEDED